MKAFYFRRLNHLFLCIIALSFVYCSSDGDSGSSSTPPPPQPKINVNTSSISFGESYLLNNSTAQTVTVDGSNLDEGIDITASGDLRYRWTIPIFPITYKFHHLRPTMPPQFMCVLDLLLWGSKQVKSF